MSAIGRSSRNTPVMSGLGTEDPSFTYIYFIWDLGWATLATFYDSDSNNMGVETTLDRTWGLVYIAVVVTSVYHAKDPLTVQLLVRVGGRISECMDHVPKVIAVVLCDTIQQALLCHAVYGYLVVRLRLLYNSESTPTGYAKFHTHSVQVLLLANLQGLSSAGVHVSTQSKRKHSSCPGFPFVLMVPSSVQLKAFADIISLQIIFTFNTGILARSANQSHRSANRYISNCEQVAASPTTFIYIFFFLLLGRLYTNSLLVTLNSRDYIKSGSQPANGEQYSLEHTVRNATRVRNLYIPSTLHVSAHVFFKMPPRDQITIRIDKDTMHDFPLSSGDDLKSAPNLPVELECTTRGDAGEAVFSSVVASTREQQSTELEMLYRFRRSQMTPSRTYISLGVDGDQAGRRLAGSDICLDSAADVVVLERVALSDELTNL
ncbi:hypothetical protein GGX14DRAFT_587161 [Mycena pura]|uniref:DUF6534 domain-containing protein n=1 Tax=Mycena pura TaxID=153505 RepID=A0AAD6UUT1_9AGAR|nr:hypothetical protein GGX14DRAFT_587161 [Mycena pura]